MGHTDFVTMEKKTPEEAWVKGEGINDLWFLELEILKFLEAFLFSLIKACVVFPAAESTLNSNWLLIPESDLTELTNETAGDGSSSSTFHSAPPHIIHTCKADELVPWKNKIVWIQVPSENSPIETKFWTEFFGLDWKH